MNKPVIVAICGKSASGKNTLAEWIISMLRAKNIPVKMIISDTTRSPRFLEAEGTDYHFITEAAFYKKREESRYLEWTHFNGWFYGTDKTQISSECVNVGIFNPEGINKLSKNQDQFEIFCIYLKCGLIKRLIRSYQREGQFKKEYLRRMRADQRDFKNIQHLLKPFHHIFIFDTNRTAPVSIVDRLLWRFKMEGFY